MIVAIIPARSKSERCKDKNIRLLGGRPLMDWAVRAARYSKYIDFVVVSTDSVIYKNIAQQCGAMVPFLRPPELAEDVPTEIVIRHVVKALEEEFETLKKNPVEIIVTLQCTSPFMTSEDIDKCIEAILNNEECDSAITVCEVREHPNWMFRYHGKFLEKYVGNTLSGEEGVSQNLEKLFIPNGMVYADRRETVMEKNLLIGEKCIPVIVPVERSIDIDTEFDFWVAEAVGRKLGFIK